nr:STAS domain-containing protein [Streptomyces taklimakanensis]
MSVAVVRRHDTVVLRPHGDVDHDSAHSLTDALRELERRPLRGLSVDLSRVSFMDSAGLHALVSLDRHCRDRGIRLVLTGVPEQPARLLDVVGLAGFFAIRR